MNHKNKYLTSIPFIISVSFVLGLLIGSGLKVFPVRIDASWQEESSKRKALQEAVGLIESNHYEAESNEGLVDLAISELVNGLDQYSMYVPDHHRHFLDLSNNGKYKGVGIETFDQDGQIYLSRIIADGPAEQAGMKRGAKILSVDENSVEEKNWNSDSLSSYLQAHSDDSIRIKLGHFSYDRPNDFVLKADDIKIPNISFADKIDDVGYIRISKFGNDVYKEFMTSLEGLMTNDTLENLVIDLRGNPGGFLQEVCQIISQLIPEKTKILETVKGNGNTDTYNSTGQNFFVVNNIAILIDEDSASASEILAGVLQDLDRAVIFGVPSYGKGLVQEQYVLSNGGTLRLSVSRYKLPSGRMIGQKDSTEYFSLIEGKKLSSTGKIEPDQYFDNVDEMFSTELFQSAIQRLNEAEKVIAIDSLNFESSSLEIEKASIFYGAERIKLIKLQADKLFQKAQNHLKS